MKNCSPLQITDHPLRTGVDNLAVDAHQHAVNSGRQAKIVQLNEQDNIKLRLNAKIIIIKKAQPGNSKVSSPSFPETKFFGSSA